MKSGNSRLQRFNAGMQMLSKLALEKIESSRENKRLRQEKRVKRRIGWGFGSGEGMRECARRRQQMAYDAGLATRRALRTDYASIKEAVK